MVECTFQENVAEKHKTSVTRTLVMVPPVLDTHLLHACKFQKKVSNVSLTSYLEIQCSPFIILCLVSIGFDHVLSESFYKGAILLRNYRKMTIYI